MGSPLVDLGTAPRLVVCAPRGPRGLLDLPGSRINPELAFISGGERCLYELATAGAALGLDVELRGEICPSVLDVLTDSAGARPRMGGEPRAPMSGEVVVVPEASDFGLFSAVALSPAQGVLFLLGPPGLVGWSFRTGWRLPDCHTVPIESLATPETLQAIDSLGFVMWTTAHGIAQAGQRAGVTIDMIGYGSPVPFPKPPDKPHDVVLVEGNRWYPRAAKLAESLSDLDVLKVPPLPFVYGLSEALGPARTLLWPSRVEGASRISMEARAVGTVPVSLNLNPFALPEDHGKGVILVPDEDSIVPEVRSVLGDSTRLSELAAAGMDDVRRQWDWQAYIERVSQAILRIPPKVGHSARGELGNDLRVQHATALGQVRVETSQELDRLRCQVHLQSEELTTLRAQVDVATHPGQAASGDVAGAPFALAAKQGADGSPRTTRSFGEMVRRLRFLNALARRSGN